MTLEVMMPRQYTPRVSVTCLGCGNPFLIQPSRLAARRYCSRQCRYHSVYSERFWSKVNRSGECWLWAAGRYKISGYGQFERRGAHRVAWELTYGPIPDGLFVLHTCDVRTCVNPAHLFLGTQADNMLDMAQKGRQSVSESRPAHKLTAEQVREIRDRCVPHAVATRQLATEYGVSQRTIWNIVTRVTWKHV